MNEKKKDLPKKMCEDVSRVLIESVIKINVVKRMRLELCLHSFANNYIILELKKLQNS